VLTSLVLMDFVERKKLNTQQIEYLEQTLKAAIQKLKFTGIEPTVANNKICNAALIAEGSYEISCIASILDKIKPLENHIERRTRVFNLLCNSGFLVTD